MQRGRAFILVVTTGGSHASDREAFILEISQKVIFCIDESLLFSRKCSHNDVSEHSDRLSILLWWTVNTFMSERHKLVTHLIYFDFYFGEQTGNAATRCVYLTP